MSARKQTHAKNRQRFRQKLRARGVRESDVERLCENLAARQREARRKGTPVAPAKPGYRIEDVLPERRAAEAETYARLSLDDRRHRPKADDPLTRGPARATGQTAKAAKRGRTVTRYEYDQAEAAS